MLSALTLSAQSMQEDDSLFTSRHSTFVPKHILSTKPLGLFLGLNVQLESTLSRQFSIQNELYYRSWWKGKDMDMLALASNLKWYHSNRVGNGWYVRAKVMGVYSLNIEDSDFHRWMLGSGLGIGVQRPIDKRWYYGADFGVKLMLIAGYDRPALRRYQRQHYYDCCPTTDLSSFGSFLFGPASPLEVAFTIGYRL